MKTKKKPGNVKLSLRPWDEVRNLPVLMFQTLKGPMMGHVEAVNAKRDTIRVYAPAMVTFMPPSNVVYLPVAFVEHHLDLFPTNVLGTNSVSDLIIQGYVGFFENFIKGGYNMQPVVMRAQIDGPEAKIELSSDTPTEPADEDSTVIETCPGCRATVADWQDHFPVYSAGTGEWTCELRIPGLREKHPGYMPPHPTDVANNAV